MKNKLSKIRLGILGGGQLARMLALACHKMGIKPYILSPRADDPACQVTAYTVKGKLNSRRDLKNFLNKVDLAVFENEFLDPALLQRASEESETPVHPKPKVMHLLQDRLNQKKLFVQNKIPTAPFIEMRSNRKAQELKGLFPNGAVLKKRNQGYDGGGVCIMQAKEDKAESKAREFIGKNPRLIAEEYIAFKKELALILVRNRKGKFIELPLVETCQEKACCVWLKGPVRHKDQNSLVKKLKALMNKISYEGVMAFELFETKTGVLLVNELAPRVHNSGHYSLNALSEDQFTLHIKAVLNMDIHPPVTLSGGFAMLNLLGEKDPGSWLPPPGTILHWYGKSETRPGRKMGHLNRLDSTPGKALAPLLEFKKKSLKF